MMMSFAMQCTDQVSQDITRSKLTKLLCGLLYVLLTLAIPKLVKPPLLADPVLCGKGRNNREKHCDRVGGEGNVLSFAVHQQHATRRGNPHEEGRAAPDLSTIYARVTSTRQSPRLAPDVEAAATQPRG